MLRRNFLAMPIGVALAPQLLLDEVMPLTLANMEQVGDEMLPAINKHKPSEDYEGLLEELKNHQVHTVGNLRRIIASELEKVLKWEKDYGSRGAEVSSKAANVAQQWKTQRPFFLHIGLMRQCFYFNTTRSES